MDGVRKTFDEWAQNGRAELMEVEHGKNVSKFLDLNFLALDTSTYLNIYYIAI